MKADFGSLSLPVGNHLLAVSGGVDSIFLLELFSKALPSTQIQVVHFDHDLRKNSKKDAKLVSKACKKKKIKFHLVSFKNIKKQLKKEKGESLQSFSRKLRYQKLREIKNEWEEQSGKKTWIVTAHHLDDQVETFLWRLSRGSHWQGLSAMDEKSEDLFRPLLSISKKEIVKEAKKRKLKWNEDETNQTTQYTRNYIRHKILPKFEKLNPNFKNHVLRLMEEAKKLNEAESDWGDLEISTFSFNQGIEVQVDELRQLSHLKIRKWLYENLKSHSSKPSEIQSIHLNQVMALLEKNKSGKFYGPGEVGLIVSCGVLRISKKENLVHEVNHPLFSLTEFKGDEGIRTQQLPDYLNGFYFEVPLKNKPKSGNWRVRSRLKGDESGSKKLKKRLIDLKIPLFWRDCLPIVVDSRGKPLGRLLKASKKTPSLGRVPKGSLLLRVSCLAKGQKL